MGDRGASMRGPVMAGAVALILVLSACIPGADTPPPDTPADTPAQDDTLAAPVADALMIGGPDSDAVPDRQVHARTGTDPRAVDAPAPMPAALARAAADCERQKGRLVPVGAAGNRRACLRDTPDAGRRCSARGDCMGECLARSGSCAPVMPLFGCHEVLNARGARVRECMQ